MPRPTAGGPVDVSYAMSGAVRGGLLLSESMFAYGLAGYTKWDGADPGLVFGAGLEIMVTKHISLQGEARRVDLGSGADATELRAGLNWRFQP